MRTIRRLRAAPVGSGRIIRRRLRALSAGLVAIIASAFLAAPQAAVASTQQVEFDSAAASTLANRLAGQTLGFYFSRATGKFVFPVTSTAAARIVRAAGGVATVVLRGPAALAAVKDALKAAHVADTAWSVDLAADQVDLNVDPSLAGSDLTTITDIIKRFGAAVHPGRRCGSP